MSETQLPQQRRSKLFVDRRLQGGLVRRMVLHWAIFIAAGISLGALIRMLTHFTEPVSDQFGAVVAAFTPFLLAMIALVPIFIVDTIKLTNRFAGPFVRFRTHIRTVADGRTPEPIRFREDDFWRETESDLNALFEELDELRRAVGGSGATQRTAAGSNAPRTESLSSSIAPRQSATERRGEQ